MDPRSLSPFRRVALLVRALDGAKKTNQALARCSNGEEMLDVHKMILAARSPFFVEIMMKNPHQCVITNIDIETLKLLVIVDAHHNIISCENPK